MQPNTQSSNRAALFFTLSAVCFVVITTYLLGWAAFAIRFAFFSSAIAALWSSFLFFRDMADFTQFWFRIDRDVTLWTWYHRKAIMGVSLTASLILLGIGFSWPEVIDPKLTILFICIWSLSLFFGYINPRIMMRARQFSGRFLPISEARAHIDANDNVIVVEVNGEARAYPDKHVLRPHIAGVSPWAARR